LNLKHKPKDEAGCIQFASMSVFERSRYPKYHKEEVPIAVGLGYYKCVQVLLNNGANASKETETGYTPVIMAAALGHTEILKMLLGHGVDVDVKVEVYSLPHEPIKWDTAASLANQLGHDEVEAILLEYSYDRYLGHLRYMVGMLVVVAAAAYWQLGWAGMVKLVAQLEKMLMLRTKRKKR
jgi:hypothetical protein